MEYYLAVKRNEVLVHVATWMNLLYSIINERSWSQKKSYLLRSYLYEMSRIGNSIEMEVKLVIAMYCGKENGEGQWL